MELPDAFLSVRMDVPLELTALPLGHNRIRIGGGGGGAGCTDHHGRAMDVEADFFAAFELVRELNLETVALVAANDKRRNNFV